jgi:GMP synthase-like glutamine amidotransferase
MQIEVMQHTPIEDPGAITSWAQEHEIELNVHRIDIGDDIKTLNPAAMDALIVLGGPQSVNDDADWLAAERIIIRSLAKLGRPVLGICLGAQQIVRAFGAPVFTADEPEYGYQQVRDSQSGAAFTAFQWHSEEMADLPGATRLYTSQAVANQGFVYHDNIVGLQFHLEMTSATIDELYAGAGKMPVADQPVATERLTAILNQLFVD